MFCIDINECDEDADGCAQSCTDTDGSYVCSCGSGYTLAADDHGCDGNFLCMPISPIITALWHTTLGL